jgi:phosphoribosylformylglycinamidine synthase
VAFRYTDPAGRRDEAFNPNGSLDAIAGILSEDRRILGMMPHPERASEAVVGCCDGALLFESMIAHLEDAHA